MRKLGFAAVILLAAVLLILSALAGPEETVLPPSPEPAPAGREIRPTPAPTAEPGTTVIDHVHSPGVCPDFYFPKGDKLLEIWMPNIKDADEAVILYDGQVYMIDCGDERAANRGAVLLKQLGIEKVDILFNTHLHHDHINGLEITDDTAKVGEVRICFSPDLTESGLRLLRTVENRHIPLKEYRDGDVYTMGDGEVKLLFLKNNETYLDMNNQSAQTLITYGERSILFMADMERPGQDTMIKRMGTDLLKCDIVKYPHHAKSDMSTQFFKALEAKMAVVTSVEGRGDAGQVALTNRKLPAVYTSVKGKFTHLVTNGKYWLVEQVPAK